MAKDSNEKKCSNCGEQKWDHRARDLACPVILEKRGVYSSDMTFEPADGEEG